MHVHARVAREYPTWHAMHLHEMHTRSALYARVVMHLHEMHTCTMYLHEVHCMSQSAFHVRVLRGKIPDAKTRT